MSSLHTCNDKLNLGSVFPIVQTYTFTSAVTGAWSKSRNDILGILEISCYTLQSALSMNLPAWSELPVYSGSCLNVLRLQTILPKMERFHILLGFLKNDFDNHWEHI